MWTTEKAEAAIVKPGKKYREAKSAAGPRSQWCLQLGKALRSNKQLATLDLSGHTLGAPAFGPLPPSAPALVREARIGRELGEALRSHWALTRLSLDGALLHDGALALLLTPLADHPMISMLDLSGCVFGRKAARALAVLFETSRTLTNLKLIGCDLHSEPFVLAAAALVHNATLTVLDLSHNPLGESDGIVEEGHEGARDGAAETKDAPPAEGEAPAEPTPPADALLPSVAVSMALAQLFKTHRTLTQLVLRDCKLDQPVYVPPEPAAALAAAPAAEEPPAASTQGAAPAEGEAPAEVPSPQPPKLPILGAFLADGLKAALKSALTFLDLSGNLLGDEGVAAFSAGLGGAKSLEVLLLYGCCSANAHTAVATGVLASGRVVMCDQQAAVVARADAATSVNRAAKADAAAATHERDVRAAREQLESERSRARERDRELESKRSRAREVFPVAKSVVRTEWSSRLSPVVTRWRCIVTFSCTRASTRGRNTPHTHKCGLTPHQQTAVLNGRRRPRWPRPADRGRSGTSDQWWFSDLAHARALPRVYGRRHTSLHAASDTSGAPLTRRAACRGR